MKIILVTYDLLSLDKDNYLDLYQAIKEMSESWIHATNNMWLMKVGDESSLTDIQTRLFLNIDNTSDRLFILDITNCDFKNCMTGWMPTNVWKFLKEDEKR